MVRITQATEQDLPHVRSLFFEYVQWLILMVETKWEYPVAITPVELVERDMADVQKFLPPDGRLLLASDDSGVVGCACAPIADGIYIRLQAMKARLLSITTTSGVNCRWR